MKSMLFALTVLVGFSAFTGCGPSKPPNDPPLPVQDSGADKNVKGKGKGLSTER